MGRDSEDWLDKRIAEDMAEVDDVLMREMMEEAKREQVEMPRERLDAIHEAVVRRRRKRANGRIHLRAALAAAAVLVLCIGGGVVTSGEKVYVPEIFQRERGEEITIKVNNTEAVPSQYDEEAVCLEIEEKLGVIPVRFGYRPKGLALVGYFLDEVGNNVIMEYQYEDYTFHVYISKDYDTSVINYQIDGEILETEMAEIVPCGLEVPLSKVNDLQGEWSYSTEFEFLNTYYMINGKIQKDEFLKIIENIAIKNV